MDAGKCGFSVLAVMEASNAVKPNEVIELEMLESELKDLKSSNMGLFTNPEALEYLHDRIKVIEDRIKELKSTRD